MRTCEQCGEEKGLSEFYRFKTKSGTTPFAKCKECTKANVRQNREANISYYREYDRKRGCRTSYEMTKKYRTENPGKYKAHGIVARAVRDGKLEKQTKCEQCSSQFSIHAHHDDYSKPLEVRWLCAACHHQWHAEHGEAKNAAWKS